MVSDGALWGSHGGGLAQQREKKKGAVGGPWRKGEATGRLPRDPHPLLPPPPAPLLSPRLVRLFSSLYLISSRRRRLLSSPRASSASSPPSPASPAPSLCSPQPSLSSPAPPVPDLEEDEREAGSGGGRGDPGVPAVARPMRGDDELMSAVTKELLPPWFQTGHCGGAMEAAWPSHGAGAVDSPPRAVSPLVPSGCTSPSKDKTRSNPNTGRFLAPNHHEGKGMCCCT